MISISFKGTYSSGKSLPVYKINRGRFENLGGKVKITNVKNIDFALRENYKLLNEPFECKMVSCIKRTKPFKFSNLNKLQLIENIPKEFKLLANIFGNDLKARYIHEYKNIDQAVYTITEEGIRIHYEPTSGFSIIAIYLSGHVSVQGKCQESNDYSLNLFLKSFLNL
jgi:hypothetical protein